MEPGLAVPCPGQRARVGDAPQVLTSFLLVLGPQVSTMLGGQTVRT